MKFLGLCVNWKVVAGLGAVAVGVFIVAPHLALAALPVLLVLACPLSCLYMMRGMNGSTNNQGAMNTGQSDAQAASGWMPGTQSSEESMDAGEHSEPRPLPLSRDQQLAMLSDQLARIEAEQDELVRELAALEEPTPWAIAEAEAVAREADERVEDRF